MDFFDLRLVKGCRVFTYQSNVLMLAELFFEPHKLPYWPWFYVVTFCYMFFVWLMQLLCCLVFLLALVLFAGFDGYVYLDYLDYVVDQ